MNSIATAVDSIVEEITIRGSAERIFDALTNPRELMQWWGMPGRFQATEVECDLRPGGRWFMRTEGGCGPQGSSVVTGEYLEIERPRLLVYTWVREEEDLPATTVRWELEEREGATTVRLTHSGFASERQRARNGGWPMILKLLQSFVGEARDIQSEDRGTIGPR